MVILWMYSSVFLQGETPLDLAKQRKNVWMVNHLQEARQAKGYDSPGYLKKLKMDKVDTMEETEWTYTSMQAHKHTRAHTHSYTYSRKHARLCVMPPLSLCV